MSNYITLPEAKSHLRVDFADDDTYIMGLCEMAEAMVEMEIGDDLAELSIKPIHSGTCDITKDSDEVDIGGDWEEDELIDHYIDLVDARYEIIENTDMGVLTLDRDVDQTDTDVEFEIWKYGMVPLPLKHAMLLLVGHFYMLREPVVVGVSVNDVPMSFKYLLMPYKLWTIQ